MLYAFEAVTKSFVVSAEDETALAEVIQQNLAAPHLAKFIHKYYNRGVVIVEEDNLPAAARKVRSIKPRYVVMPDLPLFKDPHNLIPREGQCQKTVS